MFLSISQWAKTSFAHGISENQALIAKAYFQGFFLIFICT
jgi:hypothetical protein